MRRVGLDTPSAPLSLPPGFVFPSVGVLEPSAMPGVTKAGAIPAALTEYQMPKTHDPKTCLIVAPKRVRRIPGTYRRSATL
jgi:hypothetical protein